MKPESYPEGYEDHAYEQWRDEVRRVKATAEPKWECWVLTKDDIDLAAEKLGITPERITEEAYEDIAMCFAKGFEASLPDWEPILECAVEAIVG